MMKFTQLIAAGIGEFIDRLFVTMVWGVGLSIGASMGLWIVKNAIGEL